MEQRKPDIYKAGGVLLKDRKFLVAKSKKHPIFMMPGGKIEAGETPVQALCRELQEELNVIVKSEDATLVDSFEEPASMNPSLLLKMDVFLVKNWEGEPVASSEIGDLRWIDSHPPEAEVGSVIFKKVIPFLLEKGLID